MKLFAQLPIIFLLATTFFISKPSSAEEKHNHSYMGTHGMVLLQLTKHRFAAYHLPLYVKPHDYQLLYEIELDPEQFANINSNTLMTILPERFDLNKLITGKEIELQTSIYRGHFERGGKNIHEGKIKFKKLLYKRKIEVTKTNSNHSFEVLSLFEDTQIYIHKIEHRPSFDAVFKINGAFKLDKNKDCSQPIKINVELISQLGTNCLNAEHIYIETIDFSS